MLVQFEIQHSLFESFCIIFSIESNEYLIYLDILCDSGIGDLDDFGTLPDKLKISDKEVEKLRKSVEKTKISKL